ncbi:RGM domain family member B-like [Actinia tenebrosa]|uniref:RGM domain family member B-like n=1 Tax=Actinia tenebrosa TaxID=6105 RepID=A0A6P8IB76_ACTTE|nr:RGM domain family member B-like [Actinia tenebrosa]
MYSYIIFVLLTIAWSTSTSGFPSSSGSDCNVQLKCTGPYESRMEQARNSKLKMCASLTLYQKCLDRRKSSCRAVIYYHTVKSLIPVLMREKCKNITLPKSEAEILKLFNNVAKIIPLDPKPTSKPRCKATNHGNRFSNVSSIEKRYCGLFGDPHLRTFYNSKQTCVVEGAWPLIDNEFIVVQVTNVRLVDGFSATATNKITIIVKQDVESCVEQKAYQAKSGVLPVEFRDGSTSTGTSSCKVQVMELIKDSLIQIKLCHIGTDILVRKVGQFLTFHIRMPQQIANSRHTKGLCVGGCPKREIIDYRELLSYTEAQLAKAFPKRTITRREAKQNCEDSKLKGFYLDSCVFDLLTTGDRNFTLAAETALDDAFELDPSGTVKDLTTYKATLDTDPNTSRENTRTKSKHNGVPTANSSATLTLFILVVLFLSFL